MTAILGLLLTGCAGISTAPTPEARQALTPTGKLRVALQLGNPLNVIQDSASGEMKGVAFDLGKELARRIGVPFEPVMYPSVGALLESGKSGAWDVAFVGFSPERAKEWNFSALHMEVEFGYLIPGGSSISTMADMDRPGIELPCRRNPARREVFAGPEARARPGRGCGRPGAAHRARRSTWLGLVAAQPRAGGHHLPRDGGGA